MANIQKKIHKKVFTFDALFEEDCDIFSQKLVGSLVISNIYG